MPDIYSLISSSPQPLRNLNVWESIVESLIASTFILLLFSILSLSSFIAAFENDKTSKLEGLTFCADIKLLHFKAAMAVFPHPGGEITTILLEDTEVYGITLMG